MKETYLVSRIGDIAQAINSLPEERLTIKQATDFVGEHFSLSASSKAAATAADVGLIIDSLIEIRRKVRLPHEGNIAMMSHDELMAHRSHLESLEKSKKATVGSSVLSKRTNQLMRSGHHHFSEDNSCDGSGEDEWAEGRSHKMQRHGDESPIPDNIPIPAGTTQQPSSAGSILAETPQATAASQAATTSSSKKKRGKAQRQGPNDSLAPGVPISFGADQLTQQAGRINTLIEKVTSHFEAVPAMVAQQSSSSSSSSSGIYRSPSSYLLPVSTAVAAPPAVLFDEEFVANKFGGGAERRSHEEVCQLNLGCCS